MFSLILVPWVEESVIFLVNCLGRSRKPSTQPHVPRSWNNTRLRLSVLCLANNLGSRALFFQRCSNPKRLYHQFLLSSPRINVGLCFHRGRPPTDLWSSKLQFCMGCTFRSGCLHQIYPLCRTDLFSSGVGANEA